MNTDAIEEASRTFPRNSLTFEWPVTKPGSPNLSQSYRAQNTNRVELFVQLGWRNGSAHEL